MVLQVPSWPARTRAQPHNGQRYPEEIFSGFKRVTGTEISEELRKDVYLVSVT
jgi:hypothetical protein